MTKRPRLGGWQRIGIVASVLWILGAGLAMRSHDVSNAQKQYEFAYSTCIDQKRAQRADPTKPLATEIVSVCHKEGIDLYQLFLENSWGNVASVALVPIPITWLLAYMIIGIWRWVRRGFQSVAQRDA